MGWDLENGSAAIVGVELAYENDADADADADEAAKPEDDLDRGSVPIAVADIVVAEGIIRVDDRGVGVGVDNAVGRVVVVVVVDDVEVMEGEGEGGGREGMFLLRVLIMRDWASEI